MKRAISLSPLIAIIGSLSSLVIAALLSISVAVRTVTLVVGDFPWLELGSEEAAKELTVSAVEQADIILIAAALLIIGIGLYALFVGRVENLPHWLDITSLDDLKDKLVSVVVAVLAVNFFTRVVEWQGGVDILYLGGGIGIVIGSLALFSYVHAAKKH